MKLAIDKVTNKEMLVREAADTFSVPIISLEDRLTTLQEGGMVKMTPNIGWFQRNFIDELEEELVGQIKDLQQRASSVQKFLTRTGYNVFLVVVGRMKSELILREICHITNVIPAEDVTIHKN
ncbi:hypothetical protein L798_08646 [Zootermopsis nevadensis]|uniref:Uncharacterized protein n=1 Tax=Zootermopsis nevadensis TaxID=136037 RepID=A0A067R448_ZOONE|nr:hypothetical protein L798_08646 [Zootermopsis nevadensis]